MILVPANYTNSIQFYVSNMFIKTFCVIVVGFSFRLHIRLQIPILLVKAPVSEVIHSELWKDRTSPSNVRQILNDLFNVFSTTMEQTKGG